MARTTQPMTVAIFSTFRHLGFDIDPIAPAALFPPTIPMVAGSVE